MLVANRSYQVMMMIVPHTARVIEIEKIRRSLSADVVEKVGH